MSNILGHFSAGFTLDTYILLLGGMPENYETKNSEKIITKICEYAPLVLLAVIFMVLLLRNDRNRHEGK